MKCKDGKMFKSTIPRVEIKELIFFIRFYTFLIGLLPLEMGMNIRNIKDTKENYLIIMMFMMKTMNMETMMIMITLV